MSTSTEMKPQMPSEMMKNAARVYTNQYKLLGYKKIANLIKTQHPEYSLSTKQLKEFFDDGLITQVEYNTKKQELLDEM